MQFAKRWTSRYSFFNSTCSVLFIGRSPLKTEIFWKTKQLQPILTMEIVHNITLNCLELFLWRFRLRCGWDLAMINNAYQYYVLLIHCSFPSFLCMFSYLCLSFHPEIWQHSCLTSCNLIMNNQCLRLFP